MTLERLRERMRGSGEFCQSQLWPLVETFQQQHTFDRSSFRKSATKAIPLVLVGWLVPLLIPSKPVLSVFLKFVSLIGSVALIAGLGILAWEVQKVVAFAMKRATALQKLKSELKRQTMVFLEPSFKFSAYAEFPAELYKKCGLFPSSYDRASAEDRCMGRLGETNFDLVEVKTYEVKTSTNSKGQKTKTYIRIFAGILLKADFNKNFTGHTVVQTDESEAQFGFLSRGVQRMMSSMSQLKLIELENPEFESHFKVRSTDSNAARYILTPGFMERIVALKKKYGVAIQLSFQDSMVVVALPHRGDFLEMKSGIDDLTQSVDGLLHEIVGLLEIIEDLELNNRIWNKSSQSVGA